MYLGSIPSLPYRRLTLRKKFCNSRWASSTDAGRWASSKVRVANVSMGVKLVCSSLRSFPSECRRFSRCWISLVGFFRLPRFFAWVYTGKIATSRYSPQCNNQIFKLNVNCFNGKSPIIAVRDDCGCQKFDLALYAYQLRAGLEPFSDAGLHEKYPEWLFLKINMANADSEGFAVFTNKLEKEYTVEIAHLGSDGKLHRIYLLNY